MWRYLFRRLLLLLPGLWLISSLIFLLSRLLPGDFAAQQAEHHQDLAGRATDAEAREKAVSQLRHRHGLHLPLFYFSIRSSAEPDTLERVQPATVRDDLQKLALRYGNWSRVAAYYESVRLLRQKGAADLPDAASRQVFLSATSRLFSLRSEAELERFFNDFSENGLKTPWQSLGKETELVKQRHAEMQQQATPFRAYVPKVLWHGGSNQYHQWLSGLLQGRLGVSLRDARPVEEVIGEALSVTFLLSFLSLLLLFVVAVETGLWLVQASGAGLRRLVQVFLFLLDSVPLFVLALLLLVLFSAAGLLELLPGHEADPEEEAELADMLQLLALPVLCLSLANLPYVASQVYQSLKAVLPQDFVLTARAKGLPERLVLRKHVLRNAWLPVITVLSEFLPGLVAGALVVEMVFSVPGMGRLLVDSALSRDYPVLVGVVVLVAVVKMLSHLLADLLYYFADPRIRLKA